MKSFNQSDLFWLLVDAARSPNLTPDASRLQRYKESRIRAATKAVRSRNIFLYTEGTRTSVNLNDITTIYTQPAGARLMVVGYSDNSLYGMTQQQDAATGDYVPTVFPQMHRVRVVGPNGKTLSSDLVPAQAGASGQPRFTSTLLPVPFILEADQQLAVDLAYDTAMVEPTNIPAQAFIFFCVKVKDRLTADDELAIAEIVTYIANHNYQRGIYLNCPSLGARQLQFSTAIAGGVAQGQTRQANEPLLITGIGTTLFASTILITDTYDGHSFSLNRAMRSSALNFADNVDVSFAPAPAVIGGAPIWRMYYELITPHLLRSGATLLCDVVNGGVDANGEARVDDQFNTSFLVFQGVTV